MAQPFLHDRQQFGIVASLGVEHPVRSQSGLVEARREQIACSHDPQDGAGIARRDPGKEKDGRGIVAPVGAFARCLVQGIQPEAAIRQAIVYRGHIEGRDGTFARSIALDGAEHLAQFGYGGLRNGHDRLALNIVPILFS